jgi:hypothetical protein
MKIRILIIVLLSITFFACKQNFEKIESTDFDKVSIGDKQFPFDMYLPNTIDTSKHLDLQFWNKEMSKFSNLSLDTFSIGQTKFRFINPIKTRANPSFTVLLQRREKEQWINTTIRIERGMHTNNYVYDQDLNDDGFNDIVIENRFDEMVYLFDPKSKTFVDSSIQSFNPVRVLLDRKNKIYCDFQLYKGMCGQPQTELYTISGVKKVILYHVDLNNCDDSLGPDYCTKIVLKKSLDGTGYDSLQVIEETKLDTPVPIDYVYVERKKIGGFDYVKYWRNSYKQLLGMN